MRSFDPIVGRVLPSTKRRTKTESLHARRARLERTRFYSGAAWRKLSRAFLSEHPTCCWCGDIAQMVDHILPRLDRPDLAYSRDNLRSCCRRCHAKYGKKVLS